MVTAEQIDALLPQTHCGDCGYTGCMPYAEALVAGTACIDRCPPGGITTLMALADALALDATPYIATTIANTRAPATARIDESACIGCTKCIQACPVDAIVGSAKVMHTILAQECTGCGLCIEPCPVDCIELISQPKPHYQPERARSRQQAKQTRQLREALAKAQHYRDTRQLATESKVTTAQPNADKHAKQDYILAALSRAQAKKKTGSHTV